MPESKRMKQSHGLVDRDKTYGLRDAVDLLKNAPATKFDESVDLGIALGEAPRPAVFNRYVTAVGPAEFAQSRHEGGCPIGPGGGRAHAKETDGRRPLLRVRDARPRGR